MFDQGPSTQMGPSGSHGVGLTRHGYFDYYVENGPPPPTTHMLRTLLSQRQAQRAQGHPLQGFPPPIPQQVGAGISNGATGAANSAGGRLVLSELGANPVEE